MRTLEQAAIWLGGKLLCLPCAENELGQNEALGIWQGTLASPVRGIEADVVLVTDIYRMQRKSRRVVRCACCKAPLVD